MTTLYITEAIIHNSEATVIRAHTIIIRARRRKAIDAATARAAWCAFEEDDGDMASQVATTLRFPAIFLNEYWRVIEGCVVGGDKLWKTALNEFVVSFRNAHGSLPGEPWAPVCSPNSLADFLKRRGV